jgi:hypothetical protein
MCDSVGRLVAWLALVTVIEGRVLLLLGLVVLRRRRAVGMDIHDTGAGVRERDMNWLGWLSSGAAFAMAGRDRRVGMARWWRLCCVIGGCGNGNSVSR